MTDQQEQEKRAEHLERMNRYVQRMNEVERDLTHPYMRPKDAATLILVDRSGAVAEGAARQAPRAAQIHAGQVRVSRRPRRSVPTAPCRSRGRSIRDAEAQLMKRCSGPSAAQGARIRARGDPRDLRGDRPAARHPQRRAGQGAGRPVGRVRAGQVPARSQRAAFHRPRHHAARARPRRFDARFFTADASAIAHRIEGVTGPDAELVELVWMPLAEAQAARHAGGDRRDARRARCAHRRRLRPRSAGAVLSHAARPVRAGIAVNSASPALASLTLAGSG